MIDEDNDKINNDKESEDKTSENQPEGVNPTDNTNNLENPISSSENKDDVSSTEQPTQPEVEKTPDSPQTSDEKKEHEVIHKKEGRLHIYVRQDKYKGELKSKNWVGRLYFEGKQ